MTLKHFSETRHDRNLYFYTSLKKFTDNDKFIKVYKQFIKMKFIHVLRKEQTYPIHVNHM